MKKEAMLYEKIERDRVRCFLCAHRCVIAPSHFGICGVRKNVDGKLFTFAYGNAVAANIDPIEKKPLYHFFPGTASYSVATAGCNFKCGFCQNWQISQISEREPGFKETVLTPSDIVKEAKLKGCHSISYTYTEPTIFFEYAYDTAKLAKEEGLYNVFVSNGYMTREAFLEIKPYLDAINIDLKSFREEFYEKICRGRLKPVLESIKIAKELGIWVEVTTLVIPGQNDSEEELADIAEFISGVGREIPWHISRFHPDYKFTGYKDTPVSTLNIAFDLAKERGLRYVYLGNVFDREDTYCCHCHKLLIKRGYFSTEENNIDGGKCRFCGKAVEGVFQ